VNAINPGLILTPDWKKTAGILTKGTGITVEQYLDKYAKDNAPIGRFATRKSSPIFYVFMCSSHASYCVGSSYNVDGGLAEDRRLRSSHSRVAKTTYTSRCHGRARRCPSRDVPLPEVMISAIAAI